MYRSTSKLIIISLILIVPLLAQAQSFWWGPKGGLAVGVQNWNGANRDPLFGLHGALFIESYKESGTGSFFGSFGYYQRGSSERISFFNAGGGLTSRSRQTFQFNNLSLQLGAKNRIGSYNQNRPYYAFALRLEYTLSTNLEQYEQWAGYFPLDPFVNKFNYGATVAFGYEFPMSELVGGFVEINVSPDFSRQYEQPEINGIINPVTNRRQTLREQLINNISFELSVGFRFLRKVIYLEDY